MTEVRWRWAISHVETPQPPETDPVRVVNVKMTGDAVWIDILRYDAKDAERAAARLARYRTDMAALTRSRCQAAGTCVMDPDCPFIEGGCLDADEQP